MSGYLINPSSVTKDASGNITAHGIEIKPEKLYEYAIVMDSGIDSINLTPANGGNPTYYQYVYYNHQKYQLILQNLQKLQNFGLFFCLYPFQNYLNINNLR